MSKKKFKNKKQEEWGEVLVPIHQNWWRKAYDKIRMKISNWRSLTGLEREYLELITREIYGEKCPYCGVQLTWKNMSLDHMIPKNRGGKNTKDNLMHICNRCNRRKSILNFKEYKSLLEFLDKYEKVAKDYILSQLSKANF